MLDQPDSSCSHMNTTSSRQRRNEQSLLEQRFFCHLLLFSDAFMLDQPEMLFSVGDILSALTNVSGRKHPSTVQAKQLKMCLPMMPVVLHLVTSQVDFFSPKICNTEDKLLQFSKI